MVKTQVCIPIASFNSQVDIDVGALGERKANLNKVSLEGLEKLCQGEEEMTPEERAAQKKKEIEAEFLRYKLARRAAVEREKANAAEVRVFLLKKWPSNFEEDQRNRCNCCLWDL